MTLKLATVSYLNARPLIEGIEEEDGVEIVRLVPSELLQTVESGSSDIALCPVVDFQRSNADLMLIPSGAIGCRGPALTVKLFSAVPFGRIDEIAVDGESHTSVALLQFVLHELFDRRPRMLPLASTPGCSPAEAMLLIGDKVITATPDEELFPHQLDLGDAWQRLTGEPFVFAIWMSRVGRDLGDLPDRLDRLRRRNGTRLTEIARRHATANRWPIDLAIDYLTRNLRYEIGPAELAGIESFWRRCHELGIIDELRPMKLYSRKS